MVDTVSLQKTSGAGETLGGGASHGNIGFFEGLWLASKITLWRGPYLLALYFVIGCFSMALLLIMVFIFSLLPGILKIIVLIPGYLCGGAALLSLQTGFMANCLSLAADSQARPTFALAFSGFATFRSHTYLTLMLFLLLPTFVLLGEAFMISRAAIIWPVVGLTLLGGLCLYIAAYALFIAQRGKCSTDQALKGAFALIVRHPLRWLRYGLLMFLASFLISLLACLSMLGLDYLAGDRTGTYFSTYTVRVVQTVLQPWRGGLNTAFWLALGMRLLVYFITAVFGGLLASLTFRDYAPAEENMTRIFD